MQEDAIAGELYAAAIAPFAFHKTVLQMAADQAVPQNLPPVLAATIPNLPQLNAGQSFALLCSGTSCQPPVTTPAELRRQMQEALQSHS